MCHGSAQRSWGEMIQVFIFNFFKYVVFRSICKQYTAPKLNIQIDSTKLKKKAPKTNQKLITPFCCIFGEPLRDFSEVVHHLSAGRDLYWALIIKVLIKRAPLSRFWNRFCMKLWALFPRSSGALCGMSFFILFFLRAKELSPF